MMLIGIDVGGTFTDGVLFDTSQSSVINTVKVPTKNEDLQSSLLEVLDRLLAGVSAGAIKRIVFSTTLVTNLLATNSAEAPAILLIPGPGLPNSAYNIFPNSYFLKGSIDFRGRETEKIDANEIKACLAEIKAAGISKIAVIGKFSQRNPQHEKAVRSMIQENCPGVQVAIGSETAGQMNFMRRIVTTCYSLMSQSAWASFLEEIEKALAERQLQGVQVDILKADGGTMSLKNSVNYPCETMFSGPAASTMGAVAMGGREATAVVLDIGGTTTDISLLLDGQPVYASRGATINGYYSHVNAFSTRSLPLGGDSPIIIGTDGEITIETRRRDVAACFGGPEPTVIDVFNSLHSLKIGEPALSDQALELLAGKAKLDKTSLLVQVETEVIKQLCGALEDMSSAWENEPAYKVWEVVHNRRFKIEKIIGIGAAAGAIVPALAEHLQVKSIIHTYSPVANAVGAALARPTLSLNLHIDTQNAFYSTDFDGLGGTLPKHKAMQMQDAEELARELLQQIAVQKDLGSYADEAEFFRREQFNIIRSYDRQGKIFELGVQIKPGFIKEYKEGSL